jgi:hypothetical protein
MKVISVVDDRNRARELVRSLEYFGWEHEIIQASWRGFGTKLNELYRYLENNEIKDFIFLDGYDTFALATPEEFKSKINSPSLISAEINCWPDANRVNEYPLSSHKFNFCNSGSYYMERDLFLHLMREEPIRNEDDDQRWMTNQVVKRGLTLDYERNGFQTLCGIIEGEDYIISNGRMITNLGTKPCFIHGNGKANMNFIYELI